ncbi:MAG: hypothetical protein AMXMBFR83_24650 [Phycisphaerae bacterium]
MAAVTSTSSRVKARNGNPRRPMRVLSIARTENGSQIAAPFLVTISAGGIGRQTPCCPVLLTGPKQQPEGEDSGDARGERAVGGTGPPQAAADGRPGRRAAYPVMQPMAGRRRYGPRCRRYASNSRLRMAAKAGLYREREPSQPCPAQ